MNKLLVSLTTQLKRSAQRLARKTPATAVAQNSPATAHLQPNAGPARNGGRTQHSHGVSLKQTPGWRQVRRLAAALRGQVGRWVGWALVAVMCVVLLMQISTLTTRNYVIYDLEASRDRLLRERRDLVLQLSTVQPLADLAMTATAVGMQPAGADQWTVLNAPTEEAQP